MILKLLNNIKDSPIIMQGPYFKPDPQVVRGKQKSCNDCQKKFSLIVREHQCKRCLKAICADCGSYRRDVFQISAPKAKDHRVCKDCYQASSYISDCVKNEDLKFGQTCDTGKKWLKRMTIKPSTFGTDDSQHRLLTRQVFSELWTSYSFQLRELVGLLTIKFKQDSVYDVVYNVYATIISAARQFTLAQVIHLAAFVLCFVAEDKAPFIVLYLLELRQNQKDLKTLAMNYLKALPFKNQLQKLDSYIGYRLERYSDSFFVNCLTIECAKTLITKTFQKKNLQQMLIFFATHIFVNRQQLVAKYVEKVQLSAKSAQIMTYLDSIMLRNCKLEQLTSCYKYFKGKIFSPDAKNPLSEELDHLSLRKMKTLNFERSYSPKNELYSPKNQLQLGNERNRPRLVSRESYNQNNKQTLDDSFSMNLQNEQITMKKAVSMQSPRSSKSNIDEFQQSPKVKIFPPSGQESPFLKSTEQPAIEQILMPSFLDLMKPARKTTDQESNRRSGKTCDNCLLLQEQYNSLEGRYRDERILWQKQKQTLEQANETLNGNVQKYMTEDFNKKSRINYLEKINYHYQLSFKDLQQKMNKLNENSTNIQSESQKMKQQLKNLKQKLIQETNQNIKLSAALQKQKRNVRQAREMCINSSKSYQTLKNKLTQLQTQMNQSAKRQTQLKEVVNSKQATINECKRKIAQLQEKQETITQKNGNNNLIQTLYNQQKLINAELTNKVTQKDQQILELNSICQAKELAIKKLDTDSKLLEERSAEILKKNAQMQTQMKQSKTQIDQLNMEKQKLKKQVKQLNSSTQQKCAQIVRLNILLQNRNPSCVQSSQKSQKMLVSQQNDLALRLQEREKQIYSLRRQNCILNQNLIQQQMQVKKLKDDLSQLKKDRQIYEALSKSTIEQLQQKSKQYTGQIQTLKKDIQRLQQQTDTQQLSQILLTNQSLQQQQYRQSLQILATKQSEITMLSELNQRQSKVITELTRSFQQLETNNLLLNERLLISSQESKLLLQSIGNLQLEITTLKQKNNVSSDNCQRLLQEMNLLKIELTLAKSENQKKENNEILTLKNALTIAEAKQQQLLLKFQSISVLMMEIQQEKIQLADELFLIHQFLKAKGITFPE